LTSYQRGGYNQRPRGPHHTIARKLGIGAGVVIVLGIILAVVAGAVALFWQMEYGSQTNVTFTVKTLDDQSTGSSGHKYLVFTTDGRVFENSDAWLHGKTDSSNVQAMFNAGSTYTCPVYGYRNTLFSSYQDILDGCTLVPKLNADVPASPANFYPTPTGKPPVSMVLTGTAR
jgi:hypothetical protein